MEMRHGKSHAVRPITWLADEEATAFPIRQEDGLGSTCLREVQWLGLGCKLPCCNK